MYLAVHKEQSGDTVSRERGVERAAHLTSHILDNIFSQQRLNVLLTTKITMIDQ
jgi:hypothetical protein